MNCNADTESVLESDTETVTSVLGVPLACDSDRQLSAAAVMQKHNARNKHTYLPMCGFMLIVIPVLLYAN